MAHHLTLPHLTLLVGIALGVAVILVLVIYLIHRAVRERRRGLEFTPRTPRVENEPAFLAATVQGVIADLKSRATALEERSRDAERRARFSANTLETLGRAIPQGLLIVSGDGYLFFANARARELLWADVWSRRRYTDLLGASPLAEAITECLASGKPESRERIEYATPAGGLLTLALRVEPIKGQDGSIDAVLCLLG